MAKTISKELKENIVSFYKSRPMTMDELAEEFPLCKPTLSKILKQYNVKCYTKYQLFSPDFNEGYFENIDTEEKAYFLGLIITDGCIYTTKGKSPMLALSLQECDLYILEKLKNELRLNKKITNDGRGCAELQVYSRKLVNDLRKYGIKERKSLSTVLPQNIPENLYRHMIRGILDGDGSVSFYARPNRSCHVKAIRFCQGNEKFLDDIVNLLYEKCGAEKIKTYQEKDSLWSIAYRKNDSMVKIMDYLYDGATIFLKRKKEICDLVYKEIEKYGNTEITMRSKMRMAS